MHDLIAQIERIAAGSVTDEIRILKKHRQTLDQIIKFTLGITRLQRSLESVLLLKKPARHIPRELLKILGNISDHIANLPSSEIEKRLLHIEKIIEHDLNRILGISHQPQRLKTGSDEYDDHHAMDMHRLINDFRRRTNTAIVLKLHLRTRGIPVSESVIPVDADALVAQVSQLINEEKKCRQKSRQELEAMEQQVTAIIQNQDYPDNIKQYARLMQRQIKVNIEHIIKGKDVENLPFAIEIIQLGEMEADHPDQLSAKPHPAADPVENAPSETLHNLDEKMIQTDSQPTGKNKPSHGFFNKLKVWLNTSWDTHWRDIK